MEEINRKWRKNYPRVNEYDEDYDTDEYINDSDSDTKDHGYDDKSNDDTVML